MTRRFEKRKSQDIVRRCRECGITDNDIPFLVQKNYKNGKFYKHCVCQACYSDRSTERRKAYYNKHRDEQIKQARQWNVDNKERYNARRRKSFKEKFYGL